MEKLEDFETFVQKRKQEKEKTKLEDFETFKLKRNQNRLDNLRNQISNGLISSEDAQKEMTSIANSGIIEKLNFGVNDFENGLIDSLVNIGASGEYIYNFIEKIFGVDAEKQANFFKNLSNERKEQLITDPSFTREIAKEIIPSMIVGSAFAQIPAIGSIGKNIASIGKNAPVIGKEIKSILNPLGKLSDLGLQSSAAGALSGFEGEKTRDAVRDAIIGAGFSALSSGVSAGLEKFLPKKSPKGIANALIEQGKISKKEFENILKKSEEEFFKLNPNLKNPLYKYDETKRNVLKELLQNDIVDVSTIDATKNKIRKELTQDQFPKEFGDFFNKLLKESVEPSTQGNYFANQYYRNVNKMNNDQTMQILQALQIQNALKSKN